MSEPPLISVVVPTLDRAELLAATIDSILGQAYPHVECIVMDGGSRDGTIELLQGYGLADTVGAAGFPNGEAQKSNFPYPRYNTSRLFLRQSARDPSEPGL